MGARTMMELVRMRDKMGLLWNFQHGQDAWAIAQVLAIFTWAPLFGDIVCLGAVRWFRSRRGGFKSATVEDLGVELGNLAHSEVLCGSRLV